VQKGYLINSYVINITGVEALEKTKEAQIKALLEKYSLPPVEVIVPILEKTGRGEQELTAQAYTAYTNLTEGIKEILGLKDKNMETLAKVWEILCGFEGAEFQPIELTESKYSFSYPDCYMLHVGKDVSSNVKSKFCDLICAGGSKAIMDSVLGPQRCTCTWDKGLIKGVGKCKIVFELAKNR